MDIKWAVKKLDEGKYVRRRNWVGTEYYIKQIGMSLLDSYGDSFSLNFTNLSATDWELYKEPKIEWVEMTNKEICKKINIHNHSYNDITSLNIGEDCFSTTDYKLKNGKLYKKEITK